jgi:hypothetical protein
MAQSKLVWLVGSCFVMSLAAVQGCSSDPETAPPATGGSAGATGKGGTGGGGTGGTGGTGGSAGTAGSGGSGGGGAEPSAACMAYCEIDATQCPTQFAADYIDEAGCFTGCKELEDGAYDVACRADHADNGAVNDAAHCSHASKDGGGTCN